MDRPDAEFIAAANPAVVLALIERVEDSVPKSWSGLMALLDEYYSEDAFPTMDDSPHRDPGPRIVSLIRHLDRARVERDALIERAEKAERERDAWKE